MRTVELFIYALLLASLSTHVNAACELYSLDLSDTSSYSITCGVITGGNWRVDQVQTCALTTALINLPGDSTVDPLIDIPYSVKIDPTGNCNIDDFATMEYSVNGGAWVSHWTQTADLISGASTEVDTLTAIKPGSTLRLRLTYGAISTCTNWRLFNGDLCVDWPAFTSSGAAFSSVLPVELVSFSGEVITDKVKVTWVTDVELNNDYFTLERSTNGLNFINIVLVDGAGNSSTRRNYQAIDPEPSNGNNYYRLRQTDFDSEDKYSELINVDFSQNDQNECDITVRPNPCPGRCSIDLIKCSEGFVSVSVYDATGKIVVQKLPIDFNERSYYLDSKNNLAPGIYIVAGRLDSKSINKKVIVQ